MYYINCFFLYSILGFLLESFIYKFINSSNHSGFLYGPITPIYGIGALIIIIINTKLINKLNLNKALKIFLQFIIFMIVLTAIEFLGGYLLKKVLDIELWNYSNKEYKIGKYICLELAIIWGIMGVIASYVIIPFFAKFIKKIPKKATYIIIFIFIIDLLFTVFK